MRSLPIHCMAIAMILLPGVSVAEDYQECMARCAQERETRNMDCPSPYDTTEEKRNECLNESKDDYESCTSDCPSPPPQPSEE